MTWLLNRVPFAELASEVVVVGERVRIRSNQIIVWLSMSPMEFSKFDPGFVAFPAILDTGHTHSLLMNERHLLGWARLRRSEMPIAGAIRERGQRLNLLAANVWLHRNMPGTLARSDDAEPFSLQIDSGIAIYPDGDFPRLPILGLRAIADNKLFLTIDGLRREASLRAANRWWQLF